jgi:hypothetical protein
MSNSSAPLIPNLEFLPAELRAVLELFGGELAKVSFPDIDAATLRRHAEEVAAQQGKVDLARAALTAAAAELDRRTQELATIAGRGLAYARIYAAAHPERSGLAARLASIDGSELSPDVETSAPPQRRARRRIPRPELPFELEAEAAASAHAQAGAAAVPAP